MMLKGRAGEAADGQSTPQDVFDASVGVLFRWGQLPAIVATFFLMLWLVLDLSAEPIGIKALAILGGSAVSAILLTALAMLHRQSQGFALTFLMLSLVATVVYMHFLVRYTGGSYVSPYDAFYLYLPAVVYVVARRRTWPEVVTGVLVTASWWYNTAKVPSWEIWAGFYRDSARFTHNLALMVTMLVLLGVVNRKIERKVVPLEID